MTDGCIAELIAYSAMGLVESPSRFRFLIEQDLRANAFG
jgi:hypothetical protein